MGIFDEVIDITHHSKRTQAGNLAAAGVIPNSDSGAEITQPKTSVPQNITIEKAIQFYRENAVGEYKNLYSATADYLEKLNSYSRTVVKNILEKNIEETSVDEEIPTVDLSEVSENE